MDTEDSRKRPADSEFDSPVKRLCQASVNNSFSASPTGSNDTSLTTTPQPQIRSLLSVKDMLSVPLEFVFRQCPSSGMHLGSPALTQASTTTTQQPQQNRPKPLLSRNEASCLIRIQSLAAEVDSLLQVSAKVLMEQVEWVSFHDELVISGSRHLRALLPILLTLGATFTHQRVRSIQADLTEALNELDLLAENLRQSREANWTTSDALMEAVGVRSAMAMEKRHLGDIQDEMAQRIDSLVKSTILDGGEGMDDDEKEDDEEAEEDILEAEAPKTMAEFCLEVWKEDETTSSVASPLRQSASQNSRLSVEPMGKENEPSQSQPSQSAVVEDSPACLGPASQHAAFALSSLAFSTSTPNT